MENVLVGLIVTGAVIFSLKSFIKIFKGEKGCSGCNCSPDKQKNCGNSKAFIQKKI